MLEALVELIAAWLKRRAARRMALEPGHGRALLEPPEPRPSNRLPPGAATIRDWKGENGEFLSAGSQREALLASVQQTSATRGGRTRQIQGGMQISRKDGSAVAFLEWDSRWPRPYLCDGEPFDRAEKWASAVEAEAPELVEQNRAAAAARTVVRRNIGERE